VHSEFELKFGKKKREPGTRGPSSSRANPAPFAAPPLLQPPTRDGGAPTVKTTAAEDRRGTGTMMRGNNLRAAMATAARAFSSAPAAPAAAAGVSMVQGASRGIGLEFVSAPLPPILIPYARRPPRNLQLADPVPCLLISPRR
jgi:hypothetical protein